jgi:hypothetical protein
VVRSRYWDIKDIIWENQTGFDSYGDTATGVDGLLNFDGSQDIVVDGITIRNITGTGVVIPFLELNGTRETRRITIQNSIFENYTQTGNENSFIYIYGGVGRGFARDIKFLGNTFKFRNIQSTTRFNYWFKYGDSPESSNYDSEVVVENNIFEYDSPTASDQDSFHIKGRNFLIKGNFFNFVGQITFRHGNNNIIINNIFANPNTTRQPYQIKVYGSGHTIVNNVCWSNIESRSCWGLGKGTTEVVGAGPVGPDYDVFRDSVFAHNLIYGFRDFGVDMTRNDTGINDGTTNILQSGITAHNNVIQQQTGTMWAGVTCASRFGAISHNARSGNGIADCLTLGTNNVTADPRWVNPSGGDFKMEESSPLVNAGISLTSISEAGTDIHGFSRDSSPNIGPIESLALSPPSTPTVTKYIDSSCPTHGNGTTTTCGPNGPWGGINYALVDAQCQGLKSGDLILVRGNVAARSNGNWYTGRFYVTNEVSPSSACSGVTIRNYPEEYVSIDGTQNIATQAWTNIGNNVYETAAVATGTIAGTFPFAAWAMISGTEYQLNLIQTVQTCQTTLASGNMTYNPTTRRVCVKLPGNVSPATTTYLRIPTRGTGLALAGADLDNFVIQSDLDGNGKITMSRFRDNAIRMNPSINQGTRIEGVEISHAGGQGILVDGQVGNGSYQFIGNEIHTIGQEAIRWRFDTGVSRIDRNSIHDIGMSPTFQQCLGTGAGCFPSYSSDAHAIRVNNCSAAPASDDSGTISGTNRRSIQYNEIYNIGGGRSGNSYGIHLSDCTNHTLVNANFIRDSTASLQFKGIKISGLTQFQHHHNNVITNNRCEDTNVCFETEYQTIEQAFPSSNHVYGNTCLNPTTSCWRHISGEDINIGLNFLFQNNLAASYSGYAKLMDIPVSSMWNTSFRNNGFECTHTNCIGQPIATFQGINYNRDGECTEGTSCVSDINPGFGNIYGSFGVQANTLQIASGSLAINAGHSITLLRTDYLDTFRPFGPRSDIGAHEFIGNVEVLNLIQDGYRFYDTFSYNGKLPIAPVNQPARLFSKSKFVLRMSVYGSPDSSPDFAGLLLYAQRCNPSCGSYQRVSPVCTGNALCIIENRLHNNGETITNDLPLSSRTFLPDSQYVTASDGDESGYVSSLIGEDQQLEIEYVLSMGSLSAFGDVINIQLRNIDGSVLSTYGANMPSITIGKAHGRININR